MKLLNIGERTFVTPYGTWKPMGILDVPDGKADLYLAFTGEVKVIEEQAKEVEKPAPVVTTPTKTKKKTK